MNQSKKYLAYIAWNIFSGAATIIGLAGLPDNIRSWGSVFETLNSVAARWTLGLVGIIALVWVNVRWVSWRWKEAHQRGLAGEVQRSEEDRFDRASGETIWLRWEIRPWFKEGSKVGGIVIFTEDITEGKRLRDQLRHRAEELMEVSRRKDEFLAMLGHELRNPLGPIRNGLHISPGRCQRLGDYQGQFRSDCQGNDPGGGGRDFRLSARRLYQWTGVFREMWNGIPQLPERELDRLWRGH